MSKDLQNDQKDLELDAPGPGLLSLPLGVPLDEVEQTEKRTKWSQFISVAIAGVALFSDGYNIQIAGE
jgi:hypothetical protein